MNNVKTETVPCASCYRNGCSCAYTDGKCYSTDKPVYSPSVKFLIEENKRLKEENFKMRCCGNCQRRYDGACYEYDNLCEKWSLAK